MIFAVKPPMNAHNLGSKINIMKVKAKMKKLTNENEKNIW